MKVEAIHLSNGRSPVSDFFQEMPEKALKKTLADLKRFEENPVAFLQYSGILEKMSGYAKYNLYEFKTKFNKMEYRILCCLRDSTLYLVHAFIKKTRKISEGEIGTAIKRIQTYINPKS